MLCVVGSFAINNSAFDVKVMFVFGIIGEHRTESFDSLAGLSRESPSLAVALAVAAFSLAGIPPLAGFVGKFFLFESAATSKAYFLVAFACINNVIALYYYLQLVKSAWVLPQNPEAVPLSVRPRQKFCVIALTICVLFAGVCPFISSNIARILSL